MRRKLPPLNALKAFEASARYLSFSKAAKELFLTQGAISKQIKLLEEYLNRPLFKRVSRRIELTKEAKEYYANISLALDSISSSSDKIRGKENPKENNIIIVNVFASFGTCWLIPRIQDFKNKNPDIDIYITTGYGPEINATQMDCDVGIWGYKHSFKNIENEKLLDEEMALVCSKILLSKKIKTISDLTAYPFLKNNYRPEIINKWAKSVKINKNLLSNTLSFDYLYMLIEAAKQGLGLAFIPTFLIKDSLKNNTLINPLNIKYKTKFSFYMVYPQGRKTNKIERFRKWLIEELKK